MPIQAPKIDPRTYDDIVARTQQLVSRLTATDVEATVAALTGRILDEEIVKRTVTGDTSTRALRPLPEEEILFDPREPTDGNEGIELREPLPEEPPKDEPPTNGDLREPLPPPPIDSDPINPREPSEEPIPDEPLPDDPGDQREAPDDDGGTSDPPPVIGSTSTVVIARPGTLIDAALAQQISLIKAGQRVRVRGWQPPETALDVVPTPALLVGQTLGETVVGPAPGNALIGSIGTVVTTSMAEQIAAVRSGQHVKILTSADVGATLIRIFGRMVDLTIQRINAAPEKNFLAFLDLIGTKLLPPQAARVPLTFRLAPSAASDVLLRARTPVAAPPTVERLDATVFETERDLWITAVQLAAVMVRTPDTDRYGDYTASALGLRSTDFPVFAGDELIEHSLYLARADFFNLLGTKTISLTFSSPDAAWLAALPLAWSYWNGLSWQTLSASSTQPAVNTWWVSFTNPPVPGTTVVDGRAAQWIRARLQTALPWGEVNVVDAAGAITTIRRQDETPSDAFSGNKRVDLTVAYFPFGTADAPTGYFYVNTNVDPAFMRPGATLTLDLTFQTAGVAAAGLVLTWEYGSGSSANPTWTALGRSSNTNASLDGGTAFSDTTLAMTRKGSVRITIPQQWQQRPFQNVNGYWLRIGVSNGGYGTGATAKPPQIQSVRLGYEWALPRIQGISVNAELTRAAIVPDAGFANAQPLDLSKDFYPFGERPRFNDVLYIASQDVLAKPGADVTLRVTLTNPTGVTPAPTSPPLTVAASTNLVLAWEVGNGTVWQEVGRSSPGSTALTGSTTGFADNTKALTTNADETNTTGLVKFKIPLSVGPDTINGVSNYWLRVRIVQGNYGVDASYTQNASGNFTLIEATFRPPVIRSLRLSYTFNQSGPLDACLSYNDFTAIDRTAEAAESGASFLPFLPTSETRPTLYMGFDRPFANRTTTLYAQVKPPPYSGIAVADQPAQPEPARIVWEYYGAAGWTRLGLHDETRAFAERGLLLFVGPTDFRPRAEFGRTQYWLRARWERGLFRMPPRLHRVLTNTTWASQATTIENEVLGSSDGSARQVFRTARAPVLLGQAIEVFERELPNAAERAAIEALEGRDALSFVNENDPTQGVWVRWHAVDDFYTSGPRDRHYVFDHISGEVRFGDGQRGLVPVRGRNTIRAAHYQVGGGVHGNLAAGTISQLKSSVPYVAGVTNIEAAAGGAEQETLAQLKERGPRALRHRNRAVTAQDFEDLALLTCPDVARARAVTPSFDPTKLIWLDPANPIAPSGGSAEHQAISAGRVEVIVVPRSTAAQPSPDLDLITRVEEQLLAHAGPTTNVWIAGPDWLVVRVTAQIVPTSLEAADTLTVAVDQALQRYLHPLTGGLDGGGWAFGRQPYLSDLYAFVEGIPGVDHVHALTINADTPDPARLDRFLVCSGQHQVSLIAPDEGD